jgi:cytochrome c biogenesis protein CcdA
MLPGLFFCPPKGGNKMFGLLVSTILTSAADSLNPIAITQQFVLQGMVKKPKHIWYFILPTGITNLIGGFLAYFGLAAFAGNFFKGVIEKYGQIVFTCELILGVVFLIGVCYLIQNINIQVLEKQLQSMNDGGKGNDEEGEVISKIKSVSPLALVALGVGATLSELTTALPYFAFLAILLNYELTFIQAAFILIVYNIIYTAPLIILYFVYSKAQDKFDQFYTIIKKQLTKWSNVLAPIVVGVIGVFFVFHSIAALLK